MSGPQQSMVYQREKIILLLLVTFIQLITTTYQINNSTTLSKIAEEIIEYMQYISTKYQLDNCTQVNIMLDTISRLYDVHSLHKNASVINFSCPWAYLDNPGQLNLTSFDMIKEIHENRQKVVCRIDSRKAKTTADGNNVSTRTVVRIVVSEQDEPFIIGTNFSEYSGVLFDLINEVAKGLNFDYEFVNSSGANFVDSQLPNGRWDVLIGMLQRQEADIALGSFFVTYARKTVVDFFSPFLSASYTIVIQKPHTSNSLLALMSLFTPTVWLLYFCAIILATVVMWSISKLSSMTNEETIFTSFWYIYTAQLNQLKEEKIVTTVSGRILELTWRFGFFLFISTYTGGFVAYLTASRLIMPFKSLDDLVELANNGKTPYKICLENNTALSSAIQNTSQFKDLNSLLNTINNHEYKSLDMCVQELLTDPHVAIIVDNIYAKELQKRYCGSVDLMVLDDSIFPASVSIPHRKNFTLGKLISKKITQFLQNGLFTKWMNKYSAPRKFCEIFEPSDVSTHSKPLTVTQIVGAFVLFLFGIIVAIIGLVTELYKLHIWLRNNCRTFFQRLCSVETMSRDLNV